MQQLGELDTYQQVEMQMKDQDVENVNDVHALILNCIEVLCRFSHFELMLCEQTQGFLKDVE